MRKFPDDFIWGVATSAYQIEGAGDERGASIWDRFCATPGKVRNRENAEVACDFFHRYRQDVGLLEELGVNAFRFSISWPRVIPDGCGRVSPGGLDFYDRLVDALLEAGIEPFATLYHWELPLSVEEVGGWPARATAEAFARFVEPVASRLGDRVRFWITHNEPWCASWLGYGTGEHAPGRTSRRAALAASHHLLLSHGLAVEVLRRQSRGAQVGLTVDLYPAHPASDAPEDVAAAVLFDGTRNRWFLDPVLRGAYPEDILEHYAPDLPAIADGDMKTIAAPIDFLGVNNYSRAVLRAADDRVTPVHVPVDGAEHTCMGWEVYPDGLRETLVRLHRDYHVQAIYVTENGAAYPDVRTHDGRVRDPERRNYLEQYVAAVAEALAAGAPVRGYFIWSLLDNFEWALGYWRRFGLVYVDYPTLARVPKSSFHWYRDLIRRQAPSRAETGRRGLSMTPGGRGVR
jgi:beta-glucosidase